MTLVVLHKQWGSTNRTTGIDYWNDIFDLFVAQAAKLGQDLAITLEIIREKSFPEMKKDVGMTTAQKSKETRMEMGSIFVLYIQPTLNPYIYVHYYTII